MNGNQASSFTRWETAKFNERNQVTELGLGTNTTDANLWKTTYDYGELNPDGSLDPAKNTGNIARQTLTFNGFASPLVQSYRYDSLYRITEAKETTGTNQNWIQNWSYDRYGNRTGFTQNIAGVTNAPNPAVDPLTNRFAAGQGFTYDANGNVISDVDPVTAQMRSFVFNGDNKQSEVRDANGVAIAKYFYDGEGKRVKKEVIATGETTVFVYSSGKLVAEYSTAAPPANPSINYTTTDHLGSPRVITNALGQVTSRRDFLPFGEEITPNVGSRTASLGYGTSDTIRQKFTGYQRDEETSLDFAEARMYANTYGRFTAVDPLLASGKSANPQTFNRYVYVGNCPIRIADPNGLDWWDVVNRETGKRNVQWFDEDPDEDLYEVNSRFTKYVYHAWDGNWYGLDPNSSDYFLAQDENAAKLWYGLRTDFNGDFDGLGYELTGVKDLAYLAAYIRTADMDGFVYQFEKISVLNGAGAGVGRFLGRGNACILRPLGLAGDGAGEAVAGGSTALVPKATTSLGRWGEARLQQFLGGAVEKNTKPIATSLGKRVPDYLVDGVAYEAKAGHNVGLTSTIRKQILKDAEMIREGTVVGVQWHFFQGAQKEVLDFLTENGIKYTVH